ncbi:MAG: hypothetical protein JXR83_20840 [Deltaproteobacteria bacterium]|nr:hypothetical protein [Deltaproteobacteria bacterium]
MKTSISITCAALLVAAAGGCPRCSSGAGGTPAATQAAATAVDAARPKWPTAVAPPPIPSGPLAAADTASCDSSESLLKRLACLASLAQHQSDPRYCDLVGELAKQAGAKEPEIVRSGTATNACYRSVALRRDDPQLCNRISDPSMAGSCLSYFAMKRGDPEVCAQGGGEAMATCFLNEAARTRDPSLCLRAGKFQADCERRLGPVAP